MRSNDDEILVFLQKNSRTSLNNISKSCGLPISTIFTRVKKMEEEGVIKRYTVRVDEKKVGFTVKAFVLVSYKPFEKSQKEVAKTISKLSFVERVFIISGEWDMLLEVVAKDVEDLGKCVVEKLREIKGVDKTQTLIVLEKIKEDFVISKKGVY